MRRIFSLALSLMAFAFSACIDNYDDLPITKERTQYVIDGQIVSESFCDFTVRRTLGLNQNRYEISESDIDDAEVTVKGSDGQEWYGWKYNPSHYMVYVGHLSSDQTYWLEVHFNGLLFTSEPMSPLDAPGIDSVSFFVNEKFDEVDIQVSTVDPHSRTFFMWDYDEYWRVVTPRYSYWDYDVYERRYVRIDKPYNIGWAFSESNDYVVGTNADYGDGAMSRYRICAYSRYDNRFNSRYCTRIRQMAITQEEYEYRKLLSTATNGMGGLFTPMPTELPSNIRVEEDWGLGEESDETKRVIGFIGVRGRMNCADLYINSKEVGYKQRRYFEPVPDSLVMSPEDMIFSGYRVLEHDNGHATVWVEQWVVDASDFYWKAFYNQPNFWQDSVRSLYYESGNGYSDAIDFPFVSY